MLDRGSRPARPLAMVIMLAATVWTALTATPVYGQAAPQPGTATLTLDEAIDLARRNNPDYLATANDIGAAEWAVRDAYGSLLPGASASTTYGYQAAGQPRFGNFTGDELGLASTTDYYSSSYSLGLSYRLSGATVMAPRQARSQRDATAANIDAAAYNLTNSVTRQYIAVRRAQDGVTLAERELTRADDNLRLARARVDVGAAIPMEATQAEVERGRAEVALLQASNLERTERLRLMQTLGVRFDGDVVLTTDFAIRDVPWSADELVSIARGGHPQLRAARAQATAADAGVRMARSSYLPSLNFSAGISGWARQAGNTDFLVNQAVNRARDQAATQAQSCTLLNQISAGLSSPLPGTPADCGAYTVTPEMERELRQQVESSNRGFPFGYSRDPFSMSLTVSLPLFDGFARERQVEQARIQRSDAELRVRAEELRIETEVATALANVETARRSAELETRNAELAGQQLELARERYRVGSASFLELQDAETAKARADRAQLTALYQFHENLAALAAAVGRPLNETEIR
ncbi:MAG TPA: TolC family protein [Longimicrobiales bacterium]|nr:TolC family protein [Longimicrobiales bacterium]